MFCGTAGDFLRRKFLGLELSWDRLDGIEDVLMALADALPDTSLALELPDRFLDARVSFQA